MHFLLTLSKVLKCKIVLNHFSSLRGLESPVLKHLEPGIISNTNERGSLATPYNFLL